MPKCKCCGTEIDEVQNRWSRLCPPCDLGRCQKPSEYHKLQKRIQELEELLKSSKPSLNSRTIQSAIKICYQCGRKINIEHCRDAD